MTFCVCYNGIEVMAYDCLIVYFLFIVFIFSEVFVLNEKNVSQGRPPFSGEFRFCPVGDHVRPEFRLSRPDVNGVRELVKVGEVDLVELVQSNYQNSFDAILDRFLESGELPEVRSTVENQDFLLDALDVMTEYSDFMEEARDRFGLSPDLSYSDIRKALEVKLHVENVKNSHNGGKVNEKKNQAPADVKPEEVNPVVS